MYLQHTMLHTRVNITFVQNLRHSNTNCNFGFLKEFYGPLHIPSFDRYYKRAKRKNYGFDSFMVSQFKVILVYINIVATALDRKVFQP